MSVTPVPLSIPPGVVALPTKKMKSSNWSEVNCIRWYEGMLQPIGGQSKLNYPPFASRCRAICPWFDLDGVLHIGYLCETNVYVDTGGVLTEITPSDGLVAPDYPMGGYGTLAYGDDLYGTPRAAPGPPSTESVPSTYSIQNWGGWLIVMTSADTRLLFWDPSDPTTPLLTKVAGSPNGRCFVITQERYCMIFGLTTATDGSFRRFGWCAQEDITNWDFASITTDAGFYDIEPSSPILTAVAGKFGVLFFTGKKTYVATFVGLPYIYNYIELGDECNPWSPLSISTTSSYFLWVAKQGVFAYDGTSIAPVQCNVRDWILDDYDEQWVRELAFATHISRYNEFWWFFPQNGQSDNTRAIIYNYKEGWWSQARMTRSAGMSSTYIVYPIFADNTVAYIHETGEMFNDVEELPWADSFPINIVSGGRLVTINQLIPDIDGDSGNIQYSLFYKMDRADKTPEVQSPFSYIDDEGFVNFRVTGRDVRLRLEWTGPSVPPVTLGEHLISFAPRGNR